MVDRGKFFLYDAFLPALVAGKYQLRSDIDLFDPETPVEPHVTHINVTSPRFKLPPDQTLMTFPPANSEGAYESRLPQIVLKRRTLPWDRDAGPLGSEIKGQTIVDETPWLALVIIAEGEGTIEHDIPVTECVSPGVTLSGDFDSATASRLSVPQSTVTAVFPTVDDLIKLTHVREVNLADTEAAMGDDDGFLSVVIANRMPQFDRENCKPKAYTACLINLEGQLDKLPHPTPPKPHFDLADIFLSDKHKDITKSIHSGAPIALLAGTKERKLDVTDSSAITDGLRRGEIVFHEGRLTDRAGVSAHGLNILGDIDNSSVLAGDFSALETSRFDIEEPAPVMQVIGSFAGFSLPLAHVFQDPVFRFPILTSWRFTCAGDGSFEKLMRNLDVGLLGAKTDGAYKRPQPACTPKVTGDGPDEPPLSKLPLDIAETGHVSLPHLTRTGTTGKSWYRSPFSPHRLMRRPLADDNNADPVLAHVSDHLRMMTPDGRQDVSLAVAFETGRLMAMSQPSFVAALMRWRADMFGAELIRAKQRELFLGTSLASLMAEQKFELAISSGGLDIVLEKEVFADISARREEAVADSAALVKPGQAVLGLTGSLSEHIAQGLGIDKALLDGLALAPDRPETVAKTRNVKPKTSSKKALGVTKVLGRRLSDGLDRGLHNLAELAVGKDMLASGDVKDLKPIDDFSEFLVDRLTPKAEKKK